MTQKQQEAIDTIMDYFKFEKVHKVMKFLEWTWSDGTPSVPELRQQARRLLKESFETKSSMATGGFHTRYRSYESGEETIELLFAIDAWDETIEKDLVD